MLITRKIELYIQEPDKQTRINHWKFLRFLDSEIYRAANLIVTNQLFNDFYENRLITKDDKLIHIDSRIRSLYRKKEANADEINKLKEEKKKRWEKAKKFYNTSKQNVTYQITSHDFPEIPTNIVTTLNASIIKTLKAEWNELKQGRRTLRTYKKGMPIPFNFNKQQKWFELLNGDILLHWLNGITFKMNFGRDRSNNRAILDRVLNGEYKYSDSSIQLKNGKLFLLLVIDVPVVKNELDESLSVGVDLGISVPAYCSLSDGMKRLAIGNKEDLLRIRLQMQRRRRALQKRLKLVTGGQGRNKKLTTLNTLTEKEKNYVTTYNHMISRNVIKFTKDCNASKIKLEFLEGYGEDEKNKFVLRNWSYFQLQKMIEYKAKLENISVVYVDPYHTSQTCGICGHYEEGQREKQAEFLCKNDKCKNFDDKVNADYNAALNIAKSEKIVSSKEECEYFRSEDVL